jgi:hypothetical protein
MIQSSHCPTNPGCIRRTNSAGWSVIGCTSDWAGHTLWGDVGDVLVAEIDCRNDTITVRQIDPIDNSSGQGPGCAWPQPSAEVDPHSQACCLYREPYAARDPGCAEVWTFPDADLDQRGMC